MNYITNNLSTIKRYHSHTCRQQDEPTVNIFIELFHNSCQVNKMLNLENEAGECQIRTGAPQNGNIEKMSSNQNYVIERILVSFRNEKNK